MRAVISMKINNQRAGKHSIRHERSESIGD